MITDINVQQTEQDLFSDIRPYHDDEVPAAIQRLISDRDFIHAILHYRFPHASGPLGWLLSPVIKFWLKRKFSRINTVADVQLQVADFMDRMIETSTTEVTYSGAEYLKLDQPYLFISNHRDIAMDPALVNLCLHRRGMDTVRIAIGDNLLKKPCATELMRLNKSFIVKRSAKGPRELMKSLAQLSAYIRHSLDEKQSIWIAQREGRAKDGNDQTEPAILKMCYMEGKKRQQTFAEYIRTLNIVPVCISYENDPCDSDKVNELWQKQRHGQYQKGEFEDIDSIVKGIVGFKGRVHVAFGQPLTGDYQDADELAAAIDQSIWQLYRLYPVNYVAAGVDYPSLDAAAIVWWQQKLQTVPEEARPLMQQLYAAPVLKQKPE
ncbi:1-acyl-sn-glycerol-3-phosphate acyltransferase [Chromatiaceae bacterium AAb-1]|nr:1-acyl-sn-glycerol-3-phosphate acyltransferase [Chromatiaceae bacterium AAb-1]